MKKITLSSFIDKEIENFEERVIMWNIAVNSDSGEFDLVLRDKWKLARLYQSGGSI